MIDDVAAANQAFYEAHEGRDLAAMQSVWEHRDDVVCIHPGWQILRGWPHVEHSWRQILDGPGRNQFVLTNEAIQLAGDMAIVTLDENLLSPGTSGTIAATNVFRLTDDGWKMILHQGSPVMARVDP
ncbi:MAG: ketosteroid isomerase-like protein [Candidatus Poriferisodalaceae bacterium]|jgi:ketosteroid isomerase-like protein